MVLGVVLGGIGLYPRLVEFAGAGASVPLLGFGNTLAKGVREAIQTDGLIGVLTGGFTAAAAGIAAALFFSLLISAVSRTQRFGKLPNRFVIYSLSCPQKGYFTSCRTPGFVSILRIPG